MKAAVAMSSHVMERLCQLPGVATLDWCDWAAAALCRAHHPTCGMLTVGSVDQRCVLTDLESIGVAGSTSASAELLPTSDKQGLRDQMREGDWVGWTFSVPAPGGTVFDVVKVGSSPGRRGTAPLGARWEPFGITELLVGVLGLESPTSGRVLVAELGLVNPTAPDLARIQAVLASALPSVGARYVKAIGRAPADRHTWLTPREEAILWKLVAGKKVPQIASELHRSVYTVHDHVKSLHRKLGATNRGQLVARALGHLGPLVHRAAEAIGDPEGDAGTTIASGRCGRA